MSDELTLQSHEDAGYAEVNSFWKADGRVAVVANCSGCLLDVVVETWTSPEGPRAPLASALETALGPVDNAAVDVGAFEGAFGLTLTVTVLEGDRAIDVPQTFFGRFVGDTFVAIEWSEFVCERWPQRCSDEPGIGRVIDVGGDAVIGEVIYGGVL